MAPLRRRPTLKDIAEKAKVTVVAVSLALRSEETSRVSKATRKRIRAIARRLNYRPNYMARSLVRQESSSIGLVTPTLLHPFSAEISQEIIDRARAAGYSVFITSVGDEREEREAIQELLSWGTAGLIICSATSRSRFFPELTDHGTPFVLARRRPSDPTIRRRVDYVGVDNVGGGSLAIEHLIGLGHRRIGLICGPRYEPPAIERKRGALKALATHGLKPIPQLITIGNYTRDSGYAAASALLSLTDRPTAVFAMSDLMAIGLLDYAHERGVRIPDELALVGFDGIEMAGLSGISLTTVSQDRQAIGKLAVERLVDKIEGRATPQAQETLIPPSLTIRHSCGAKKGVD